MKIGSIKIEVIKGNIVEQNDIEAIVNAANAQLQTGGGVAGAIHKAAGPELDQETITLAPIRPGGAVITRAYNLPNNFIIHVLGPLYGTDKPEENFLSDCYKNAIRLAEERRIESIAFPAISTGAFGYPLEAATNVALSTLKVILPSLKHVKLIRFVLFSDQDLSVYQQKLEVLGRTA